MAHTPREVLMSLSAIANFSQNGPRLPVAMSFLTETASATFVLSSIPPSFIS
jgi:hypothetical protein